MIYIYIGSAIAAGVLIGIVSISVLWIAKQVSSNILQKTSEIISTYDEIIEEKSKLLRQIESEIEENNNAIRDISAGQNDAVTISKPETDDTAVKAVENIIRSDYIDAGFASSYKKIRDSFTYDSVEICNRILEVESDEEYDRGKMAQEIINDILFDTIFEISTFSSEEQIEILKGCMEGEKRKLLDSYLDQVNGFNIVDFFDSLKKEADDNFSKLIIRVTEADSKKNYPEDVTVIVDDNICEGFRIEVGNRVYDYCVREGEIS